MSDIKTRLLMEFFESQGMVFTDYETGKPLVDHELTLCGNCQCMTRTLIKDNTCMKCGARKK